MSVRFGTDGVRGLANSEVTPEVALAIGRAVVEVLGVDRVVTGRDTRRSGTMLEAAVSAGVASRGASAASIGVAPTPAVAFACSDGLSAGVMVSASHNPFADNGLKVFAPGGHKLSDAEQDAMEHHLAEALDGGAVRAAGSGRVPTGGAVGRVGAVEEPLAEYRRSLLEAIGNRSLEGISLVLDCANGSNHELAPEVLRSLGASVEVMGDHPDGCNINDGCGSNHPEGLASAVVGRGAPLGIAFDGDADRVVAVDRTGRMVDGDHIMAMCAIDMRERGLLTDDTVVVTVMTNLGFRRAMQRHGIAIVETPVGDRHVLGALRSGGYALGGEQSGHIVFARHSSTGDGLLSALVLLDLLARTGRDLAALADEAMTRLPQVLVNVPVSSPMPDATERLADRVAEATASMDGGGRIVLRPSGTEAVVRVMVEAESEATARAVAEDLAGAVAAAAGGP